MSQTVHYSRADLPPDHEESAFRIVATAPAELVALTNEVRSLRRMLEGERAHSATTKRVNRRQSDLRNERIRHAALAGAVGGVVGALVTALAMLAAAPPPPAVATVPTLGVPALLRHATNPEVSPYFGIPAIQVSPEPPAPQLITPRLRRVLPKSEPRGVAIDIPSQLNKP